MSILDSFPSGKSPRSQQVAVLKKVEAAWDDADVIVIDAPVASGKSLLALTIMRWALKREKLMSRLLTPVNVLVEQYVKDFPFLHTLPAANSFTCLDSIERSEETGEIISEHSCASEKGLGEKTYCSNCPYLKAKKKGYATPFGVYNYYTYIANKYYRPVLILDEAHNSIPILRDLNAKKYWQWEFNYPNSVRTYGQLYKWLAAEVQKPHVEYKKKKLEFFLQELISNRTRYVVDRGVDLYRGRMEDCIKMMPVDVRYGGGLLWPKKVQKIVLMSATISRIDIESLGLDNRRVVFISAESAIPKEQRPIYLDCNINLSFKYQMENLSKVVEYIKEKLRTKSSKGLIHCTYSLSRLLKPYLEDEPRLIWHEQADKMQKYREFLNTPDNKVLMACGLYEGIDLPDELGRWQVLLKVPYPSLESPAIKHLAETNDEWYSNEAAKIMIQAVGRICRNPKDFGESFILDSSFRKLYDEYRELFPPSFIEAVVNV